MTVSQALSNAINFVQYGIFIRNVSHNTSRQKPHSKR